MTQTPQRLFFKLADAFAAQAKFIGDFFKGMRLAATQPKSQPQNMALSSLTSRSQGTTT